MNTNVSQRIADWGEKMIILTIKDERGKLEFEVELYIDRWRMPTGRYDVLVWHTPPRKRSKRVSTGIATDEEIKEAKTAYWKSLEPK